ncbi:MAG: O-antigen ligase family protein [Patescibacteria group bacterium]
MSNYFKISKFLLVLPVLGIFIVSTSTLFPFIVGKYVWFRSAVDFAFIAFLLGLLFNDDLGHMWERVKAVFKQPLVIAVSLFVAVFLLAGFFGVDPMMSFWSNFERGEGGLQLLHFWLWFTLLVTLFREEKDWQNMFVFALIGGALMAAYGFLAGLGANGFIGPKFGEGRMSGSIGNSSYTAAYSIFMLFYIGYLLVSKYKTRLRSAGAFILYALAVVFLIVFVLAATRGAFMGLVVSATAFMGFFVYTHKAWRKWLITAMVALVLVVGLGIKFKDSTFIKSLPGSRIFDISVNAETFSDRTIMWKIALNGAKDHPFLGWGPENYLHIFDQRFETSYFKPTAGFGAWFDRAHSIYFDYLAETGILGLASFLGIFVVFYMQFFKKRKADSVLSTKSTMEQALLFSILFAYLVQGIVLFDVSPIYLNTFLILAFGTYQFSPKS